MGRLGICRRMIPFRLWVFYYNNSGRGFFGKGKGRVVGVVGGWEGEETGLGLGYGDRVVCFLRKKLKIR